MIELVMFDADGVLFDSTESNIAYYNFIFAQLGEPPLDRTEEIASISYAASEVFAARARGDVAKLARMHDVTRTMDQTPFFKMLRPPLELRPFMLKLKRRYKLGLAGVFDAVASALDKVRPKPAPYILRLCLDRAAVEAPRAVYVGDSRIDYEAADSAGMHFIGVGTRIEHTRMIATIADLEAALERLDARRD